MLKISTALLALMQLSHLHAALYLNDQRTLDVPIPKRGLTRLSVQDDLIQDIFVYPQMMDATPLQESLQLHKSGHVFIAPEGIAQSFYLTVMTQKGKVQDLKIMPGSHSAGPVILTAPLPEVDPQKKAHEEKKRKEAALIAAVQGFSPPGFHHVSFDQDSIPQEQGLLQKTKINVYQHKNERIDVYILVNKGDREIFLTPSLFLNAHDLAVVFDQPSLPAGGEVRLAILRQTPLTKLPHSLTPTLKG